MAKQNTTAADAADLKAAAARTAAAKASEAEAAKAAKAAEGIAAAQKKSEDAAAKESLVATTKTVSVSHGGNGFLVTETNADGAIHQYHSETDPTKK